MSSFPAVLYIVVPCYNECEVFPMTATELTKLVISLIEKGKISDIKRIIMSVLSNWQAMSDIKMLCLPA